LILSIQKRKAEEELRPVPSVVSLTRVLCGLVCFFYGFFHTTLFAQTSKEPVGENFEFFKMESESLKGMAKEILNHDSSRYKFELNKKFGAALKGLLTMQGSFDFPFDSLVTISKIYAPDYSFRIFSWYIVDEDQDHFYYALLQRKVKTIGGKDSLIVQALNHTQAITADAENLALNQNTWLGALFYKVLMFKSKGYRRDFYTGKVEKAQNTYYVLLGWNGGSKYSTFKMIEPLTFDEQDVEKIHLGAPLFYFNAIPKYRVIYEYSDNAFFKLNAELVDRKWPRKSVEMIVFDHLSPPNRIKKHEMLAYGPDGSYDGLYFRRNRGGNFGYFKNVRVIDRRLDKYKTKDIEAPKGQYLEKGLFHPLMKK
jgi:hypothetical protein